MKWLFHFLLLMVIFLSPLTSFAGEKFDKMTTAEHLKYAKDAIAKKNFTPAKMHLDAIPIKSPEYEVAKKLYKEIGEKNAEANRIQQQNAKIQNIKNLLVTRKAFAKIYQDHLLDNNMDAYVSTLGKNHTTLRIKYILVSRPLVHKLSQDGEYWEKMRSMGFKKVIFTNGYDNTWSFTP